MSNVFLPTRYDEIVHRLAVGIEPRDAVRGARIATPLAARLEQPAGLRQAQLLRHASARWSLRYVPGLPGTDRGEFLLVLGHRHPDAPAELAAPP